MNREEIEERLRSHAAEPIGKTETKSESEILECLDNDVTHLPPSKEQEGEEVAVRCLKKSKKSVTLLALLLVHFLCLMDLTIVSTTLTVIGADFNAFASISWVINAYILTYDVFQLLFAKFNDIFGRKKSLITAVCIFLVGSLLSGVSTSLLMLVFSRAVTGIGSAGVFSAVTVSVYEMGTIEHRGISQGILNGVYALSSVFGPYIGAALSDNISWRWMFYINLPIGGVSLILVILLFDPPTSNSSFKAKLKRIDYAGLSTILTAAILLILALNFGGMTNTWNSVSVVVPLVLSIVLIAMFGVIEWKFAVDPILSPHLIRNRSLMMVCISNAAFGANLFTVLYYLPVYLQVVKGDSTELSSIHLMPMRIATVVTSVSTGPLTGKTMCYRPYLWTGMIIIILHVGLISLFGVNTSYAEIFGITFLGGCGMGIVFPATAIAIISSIEPKHISVANGFGHFCRLLGASFGIAIANSILNTGLENRLPSILPPEYIEPVISSSLFVRDGLPDQYKAATLQVYADVLRMIWYTMIPLTSIGFISSLFAKNYDLKNPGKFIAKANPINVNSEVIEIPQAEQVDNSMVTSEVGSNLTRQGDKSSRDHHPDPAIIVKTSA